MNEDLELFLWLVGLFYLFDCTYWVRPGCLVFLSHLGERHRLHSMHNRALIRNDRGGFLAGNLLPLGTSAQCQFWPVSLSPEGAFSWVAQVITPEGRPDQPARFYRYDDMQTVTQDENRVLINGKRFVTCCSPELAGELAHLIEKLAALPADRREAVIDTALAEATNTDAIAERFKSARGTTFVLRLLCCALVGYLFVFVPVSVIYDLPWSFLRYIGVWFFLATLTAFEFTRAWRMILPREGGSLVKQVLMILIWPANAIHARNALFRSLLSAYHPLAVARVLCPPARFAEFARHVLLDLRHPMPPVCPTDDPAAVQTENWFREKLTAALAAVVQKASLDAEALCRPPAPEATECRTYCPRCRGQYVLAEGTCSTCSLPLQPLPAHVPEPESMAPVPPAACPPVSSQGSVPVSGESTLAGKSPVAQVRKDTGGPAGGTEKREAPRPGTDTGRQAARGINGGKRPVKAKRKKKRKR
jgi:hypothetical protein